MDEPHFDHDFAHTYETGDEATLGEDVAQLQAAHARRVASIAAGANAAALARPTEAVTALRRLSDEMLAELLPDVTAGRQRWARELDRFADLFRRHDAFVELDDAIPIWQIVHPTGDGDFRFAGSSSFGNNADVRFGGDRPWNRMWGHIDHSADANDRYSFGVIETYGLTPDRFPDTSSKRFEIATDVRIVGVVSGWTGGYHWLWAADDKWCKAWLKIRHTLRRGVGPVLAEAIRPTFELFNLENVTPVGQASPVLNGGYGGRILVDLDLDEIRNAQSMLTLDVEVRFDVELEGDAEIWFRERGGSASESIPAADNAVRWASAPMFLRPL